MLLVAYAIGVVWIAGGAFFLYGPDAVHHKAYSEKTELQPAHTEVMPVERDASYEAYETGAIHPPPPEITQYSQEVYETDCHAMPARGFCPRRAETQTDPPPWLTYLLLVLGCFYALIWMVLRLLQLGLRNFQVFVVRRIPDFMRNDIDLFGELVLPILAAELVNRVNIPSPTSNWPTVQSLFNDIIGLRLGSYVHSLARSYGLSPEVSAVRVLRPASLSSTLVTSVQSELSVVNDRRLHCPFLDLPPGVAYRIFTFATLSAPSTIKTIDPYRTSLQYVLPQVSRTVRKWALDTPSLWTRMYLPVHATCASDWLSRSGELPIDIAILRNAIHDGDQRRAMTSFLSRSDVMSRCRSLRIDVLDECPASFLSYSAPILEFLDLHFTPDDVDRLGGITLLGADAPLLRTIYLYGPPLSIPPQISASLTEIEVTYTHRTSRTTTSSATELIKLLREAPALEVLGVAGVEFGGSHIEEAADLSPSSNARISLPGLERAVFIGISLNDISHFLPRLVPGPRFCGLVLKTGTGGLVSPTFTVPQIPLFHTLRTLTLGGSEKKSGGIVTGIGDAQVLATVVQTPLLEKLALRYVHLTPTFHGRLAGDNKMGVLIPRLMIYNLVACFGFSSEGFLELVHSRRLDSRVSELLDVVAESCCVIRHQGSQLVEEPFNFRFSSARR